MEVQDKKQHLKQQSVEVKAENQQIVTAFEHALNKLFVKITRSTLLLSMAF